MIIIIEGLSLLQSIPLTTANKQCQTPKNIMVYQCVLMALTLNEGLTVRLAGKAYNLLLQGCPFYSRSLF